MRQITVRFKLVTQAYLGGADPLRAPAELRAPTFRGLLRYWLRAAAGARDPDSAHVRAIEDVTFGSVESGSPISLWLSDEWPPAQKAGLGRAAPPGHVSPLSPEQRYLFWSMDRRHTQQKALPAGMEFNVHLALRGGADNAGQAFEHAIGALWLLAHLGGVGARSRRGAGSLAPLRITGLPDKLAGLPFEPAASAEDLQLRLKTGIPAVCAHFPAPLAPHARPASQRPEFDILAPDPEHCRIWILRAPTGAWSTADDVLDALGASLRDHRRSIPRLIDRAVFGLPLIVPQGGLRISDRRASPLLLRVSSVASGTGSHEYLAVAVLFKSQFQPGGSHDYHGTPNYGLVEGWASSQYFKAMEVSL